MAGPRTYKVFGDREEQKRISPDFPMIEQYDCFALVKVAPAKVKALTKAHVSEDITDQYTIAINGREIATGSKPSKQRSKATLAAGKLRRTLADGKHHYLVQFVGPIKKTWLTQVRRAGGEIRGPLSGFVMIVRSDTKTIQQISSLPCVRWTGHLPYENRVAESVFARIARKANDASGGLPRTRVIPSVYVVDFFDGQDANKGVRTAKQLGIHVLDHQKDSPVAIVEVDANATERTRLINALSAIHGVRHIRERTVRRPSNDVAAEIMGTSKALSNPGPGLSGAGEIIGICDTGIDTGDPSTLHKDFAGRLLAVKSYPLPTSLNSRVTNPEADDGPADLDSGHGTHCAGSVLGDGTESAAIPGITARIRGLAYKAKLVFQAVEQETKWKRPADLREQGRYGLWGIPDDLRKLFQFAYSKGVRVHSNSWGGGDPGVYDEQCQQLDEFIWKHQDFCVLVAAGNDGTDKDGDGRINRMSVTSPATAKNCITVGASENVRENFKSEKYGDWWPDDYPKPPFKGDPIANNADDIAAFSSRGPTADGRVKPDVVAPGTFILSTRSTMIAANNKAWAAFPPSKMYFHMGGTSMATPLTAGAVAILREFLRTKQGIAAPSAALLKATLIAGATRIAGLAPPNVLLDNHQGFGRVNIDAVVAPAKTTIEFLDNPKGLATDQMFSRDVTVPAGANLLRVVLAYSDFPGPALVNNLNLLLVTPTGQKFVGNQAGSGSLVPDAKNNVEALEIPSPAAGAWKLQVVGSNIPSGPQKFALVIMLAKGPATTSAHRKKRPSRGKRRQRR